jgi:hypothetical protein
MFWRFVGRRGKDMPSEVDFNSVAIYQARMRINKYLIDNPFCHRAHYHIRIGRTKKSEESARKTQRK